MDLTQSPNPLISEIYSTGVVKDKHGEPVKEMMRSGIPYDQGMALYDWIRKTEPKQSIEVGMAYGLSTLFICQAHLDNGKGGRHLVIDPKQHSLYRGIGLLNLDRANLAAQLEFYEAPSYEILPKFLDKGDRTDFIFIDGMHTFDFTLVDFFYSDLILKTGGHIVFDDIWMPSVRKVLAYILRNRSYRLEPDLIWKPGPFYQRALRFATRGRSRKIILQLNARQFAQNPLDLLTFFDAARFFFRGSLKYCGVQKLGDDERKWDSHRGF